MRTNIEIDEALMAEALSLSGLKTKRAVVEEGLRLLIRLKRPSDAKALFGQARWQGSLEQSRTGRRTV